MTSKRCPHCGWMPSPREHPRHAHSLTPTVQLRNHLALHHPTVPAPPLTSEEDQWEISLV